LTGGRRGGLARFLPHPHPKKPYPQNLNLDLTRIFYGNNPAHSPAQNLCLSLCLPLSVSVYLPTNPKHMVQSRESRALARKNAKLAGELANANAALVALRVELETETAKSNIVALRAELEAAKSNSSLAVSLYSPPPTCSSLGSSLPLLNCSASYT
jgi:hypothetical protein